MTELALARTPAALFALRIATREPDDLEVERLPRSIFWQD
jgi:hypothetical protein